DHRLAIIRLARARATALIFQHHLSSSELQVLLHSPISAISRPPYTTSHQAHLPNTIHLPILLLIRADVPPHLLVPAHESPTPPRHLRRANVHRKVRPIVPPAANPVPVLANLAQRSEVDKVARLMRSRRARRVFGPGCFA